MTRSIRCSLQASLVFALVALGGLAAADEDGPDAAALALFRKGRDLIAAGDWSGGCENLAQSYSRARSASTLLNLARCDEHDGKIASAWARYVQALPLIERVADPTRRDELATVAREGAAKLVSRLPKIMVTIQSPREGVSIEDERHQSLPIGEAIPLDPGAHSLTARASGFQDVTAKIELEEGRTTSLSLMLERVPAPPPTPRDLAAPAGAPTNASEFPWLAVGVGTLGVGLGAVAVGFGVDSANASSTLRNRCGADLKCDEDPSFDPEPYNHRKDQGLELAVGLGGASLVALGVATWLFIRSAHTSHVGNNVALLPGHVSRLAISF